MSTESLGRNAKKVVAVAVLVTFVVAGVVGTAIASSPSAGIDVQQTEGEVKITVVTPGNRDSMQLVAPRGTRSFVMPEESMEAGSRLRVRSNETVYEFFKENNVTIPTTTQEEGYMRITSPEDVPSQDLALQNDDLTQNTSYDRRSAYLTCLYNHPGFEIDENAVQQKVSIPCHAPVLAQFDSIQAGTSKEIGNETVTTPLILEKGDYILIGGIGGDCVQIQSVSVSATVASGESLGNGFGDTDRPEICTMSGTDGEGGVLPSFAYLIALLAVAVVVAAAAYRRF